MERDLLIQQLLKVTPETFDRLALEIYHFQYTNNTLYRQFSDLIGRNPRNVQSVDQIPYLPIRFFKSHSVVSNAGTPSIVFRSSTTTGQTPSIHKVFDTGLYKKAALGGFEAVMGAPVRDFRWLALLPSYLERGDASLVFMAQHFIDAGLKGGGFFLNDPAHLNAALGMGEKKGIPSVLVGVSFALLEFATEFPQPLHHTRVIETGGMKGRGEDLTRDAIHGVLKRAFSARQVWSEYGMTELLSQAWSKGDGQYVPAPTLRIAIRDLRDPMTHLAPGERGGVDCIDLANIDSCAFIQSDDLGVVDAHGHFEVLGRLDGSEARGCNLML